MRDRQKEVHGRVGEKNLPMQEVGENGDGDLCRSIRVERGEGDRSNARKVDQMDVRSGLVREEIEKNIFRVRAGRRAVKYGFVRK